MKPQFKSCALSVFALLVAMAGITCSLAFYYGSLPNLAIPFIEGHDPLFVSTLIKIVSTQSWWPTQLIQTARLSAPFGFQLGDYPMGDLLQFFVLKVINAFTANPYETYNLYYLSSFYLVAASFFVCVRRLGASRLLSIPLTIAFTIIPFHFSRYGHVLFAQYIWVAPLALIVLLTALGRNPLARGSRLSALAIVALASFCGIYYAFFFCFFLTIAVAITIKNPQRKARLKAFGVIVGIMMALGSMNYVSNLMFTHANGNTGVSTRNLGDCENGGMRLATFMLPTHQSMIDPVREKIAQYKMFLPPTEGTNEYGGFVAIIFFCVTIGALAFKRTRRSLRTIGVLNLAGILFGVMGGLNIIFGLFITPSFRSENRISVFIVCFALFAAALVIKRFERRQSIGARIFITIAMSVFIIFDQTPAKGTGLSAQSADNFARESAFFKKIEASCAADSSILQLPFTRFPESPPVGTMLPYEHFKAFNATETLRWSYGAMRGREAEVGIARVSQFPLDLNLLREAHFAGVEIDTNGFGDQAPKVLESLKKTFGASRFMSENARYFFFATPSGACANN